MMPYQNERREGREMSSEIWQEAVWEEQKLPLGMPAVAPVDVLGSGGR